MSITFDFSGRTALVTGSAQGIGFELAKLFSTSGAKVAVADWDGDRLKAEWGEKSDTVLPLKLDVSDDDAVSAAVEEIVGWSGSVDIAVNNAGITRDTMVWKMDPAQWHEVIGVHLHGTYHVSRAVIPHMRKAGYGRIVNVTSYSGLHGNVGQTNYSAAKAGIVGFTKAAAKEVARFGITVNAISPNAATQMTAAVPKEKLDFLLSQIPLGRWPEPRELAATVGFLASEEAGYTTGAVVLVDGGMSV